MSPAPIIRVVVLLLKGETVFLGRRRSLVGHNTYALPGVLFRSTHGLNQCCDKEAEYFEVEDSNCHPFLPLLLTEFEFHFEQPSSIRHIVRRHLRSALILEQAENGLKVFFEIYRYDGKWILGDRMH